MRETDQPSPQSTDTPQVAEERREEKETGRLEAFSDGIFAVAITLLVLNIQVPSLDQITTLQKQSGSFDLALGQLLLSHWSAYLAFLTSFATIGIMWVNHHRLFNHIRSSNDTLLAINLLLLLVIVFIPFPTALFAEYLAPTNHLPAVIYSATNVFLAIFFGLLWRYASHNNRLLDKKADPLAVQGITRQYRFGPLLYLVALGLAFLYPPASIIWCLLLAVFFALPGHVAVQLTTTVKKLPWPLLRR